VTSNKTECQSGDGRAGQVGEGVYRETGELSQAGLEAQRELEAFLGRVAAGGGQAPGQGGKRRKSKQRGSGGLSPLARRLLRMFVAFRAFQVFPMLALCFVGSGSRSRRKGKWRGSARRPMRVGGGGGRGIGRGRRPSL